MKTVADSLIKELTKASYDPYYGTSLAGYKFLTTKAKGAYGEKFTKALLVQLGHTVTDRTDSGHDGVVDGFLTEFKFSVAGGSTAKRPEPVKNRWIINHVAKHKSWERLIFVGINKDINNSVIVFITKQQFIDVVTEPLTFFRHQQGGEKGKNDDYISSKMMKLIEDGHFLGMDKW